MFLPGVAAGAELPAIDALGASPRRAAPALRADQRRLLRPGKGVRFEERLGVPTFVWAAPSDPAERARRAARPRDAAAEARRHLGRLSSLYGLDDADVAAARVTRVHDTGRGGVVVEFREDVNGVEVFREQVAVLMDRDLEGVAISGFLTGAARRGAPAARVARLRPEDAIAAAVADRSGGQAVFARDFRSVGRQDAYGLYDYAAGRTPRGHAMTRTARSKDVYFHTADRYVRAYYVEVAIELADTAGAIDNDMYAYVISADDGAVLFRKNLTANDSYAYRGWADTTGELTPEDSPHGNGVTPHPTGLPDGFDPPFVAPSLVTLENGPISTNDPWLPDGATETTGNNVDAYADLVSPDGFTAGDIRATTTGPSTFDRTYDTALAPDASANQRMAGIAQIFYTTNHLHDVFYDHGFDEASGNAQQDNFGRGGIAGDRMRAESQDRFGDPIPPLSNANMSTPADGGSPRMQMFVWSGRPGDARIEVTAQPGTPPLPATIDLVGKAEFGPQSFDETADVVLVNDGAGLSPTDGCETPFVNAAAVAGNIALLDRGNCTFAVKAANAAGEGAVGVIVANNVGGTTVSGMGTGAPCLTPDTAPCTAGALMVSQNQGADIKAALLNGTVTVRLLREPNGVLRDGALENTVVAHEWGHYLSNRLIGDGAGISTNQSRGLGEGWGDFVAHLMIVRNGEDWGGIYAQGVYAAVSFSPDPAYFGIRRFPYSTDLTKNPLTFEHIDDSVPIVSGAPCDECGVNPNSEVHNTGEVWASMLWECYAALLNDTLGGTPRLTFAEAQGRMRDYLVASLKMTPTQPTFVEARDAVLAVAAANDLVDHALFCDAFAKRGLGQGAIAPDRFSTNNVGVVESFACQNVLEIVDVDLVVPAGCDGDGYLDNDETGVLSVTVRNIGGGTLTSTSAQASTTHPLVTLGNGGMMTFATMAPFEEATGTVNVSIAGAVGIEDFRLDVDASDPTVSLPIPGASLMVRANADEVLAASATDDVEAGQTVWTSVGTGGPWVREQIATNPPFEFVWSGPDASGVTDFALTSPPLQVSASGSFGFTFQHRHGFEASGGDNFDGGVLELSADGGTTWSDIGASASPGYTGTIDGASGSPIALQPAYTGQSAGYPAFAIETVDLGTAYQGQTVRVRFRLATDAAAGGDPWQIDDIAFTGIVGTPFPIIVAQPPCFIDGDGDTYDSSVDCNDADPDIHPTATEVVDDGVDQDCDDGDLCYVDEDGDGFRPNGIATIVSADLDCGDPGEAAAGDPVGDCNDTNPGVNPGAGEVCSDLVDNDCDTAPDCADPGCTGSLACPEAAGLCGGGPFVCKFPGRTKLSIRNSSGGASDAMAFSWTVGDATDVDEFGDPTVNTPYTVCVWDHVAGTPTLVMRMDAPAAGNCAGRPCWRSILGGARLSYRDPGALPHGIQRLQLRSGPLGKSRVTMRGKGDMLPDPPMPFQQSPRITVQVVNSLGKCWGADYVNAARVNTPSQLLAKERP